MIYRRVINGAIDGIFFASGGGLKVGRQFIPLRELNSRGYYKQVEPAYDPTMQIVDNDYYFDEANNIVTRKIREFQKGIAHNWKARNFSDSGVLLRPVRVRVVREDTYSGNTLEVLADKMLKSGAPYWQVDANGSKSEDGTFLEVYVKEISATDLPAIEAYVSATEGAVIENYNDLI